MLDNTEILKSYDYHFKQSPKHLHEKCKDMGVKKAPSARNLLDDEETNLRF